MLTKKYLFSVLTIIVITSTTIVRADDISSLRGTLTDTIAKLIQTYEARIQTLETENATLKQEIATLKGTGTVVGNTAAVSTGTISPTSVTVTTSKSVVTATGTDTYSQIINKIVADLPNILTENKLPPYTAIGLFEFINPDAFFISLDDGNNPAGVTAFKTKILYKYDSYLHFTKAGVFDLDYTSQRYRTIYGSNPYSATTRTRIQNPGYKGKLLTPNATTSATATPSTSTANTAVVSSGTDVTFTQIKTAYDSNKLLNALTLSDQFIIKNPNDIEVLRIRYRSYYMVGKYENSLAEVKKIETLQGNAFERTIACDAAVIGKIAKKTDTSTYYSTICKKK